jgi:phage repressor protein C with HTH and peptisase S24 domain
METQSTLARNIVALRKHLGDKQAAFAERLDVDQSYISKWETKNAEPAGRSLARMAELAGVRLEEFMDLPWKPGAASRPLNMARAPDSFPNRIEGAGDVVDLIALDLSLSMGPGTLIEDMVEETPVKFDLALLRRITRTSTEYLRLVRGVGDSMEPTLRSTDHIVIDTSEKTMSRIHGIYWIDMHGAHGIKRLRPSTAGKIWVISDNKDAGGEPFEVAADDLLIHGRAIWCWREL